jgi:predicted alpha-1,6-mannanase (GH76 family)
VNQPGPSSAAAAPPASAGERAAYAATSVTTLFGRRMLGVPGTLLPLVTNPGPRRWRGPWHYWWLAHYLDCLVDQALREHAAGDLAGARATTATARRLLRTIRIRNVAIFTNHYYDDMAWLLLAVHRLDRLTARLSPGTSSALTHSAGRALRAAVTRGHTDDLDGGLFWNDHHDFKNVAATGPAALFFARIGDRARARSLLDWLHDHLRDPATGLFVDGLRIAPDGTTTLVPDVFTYNQGTVLAALITLGDPISLARAEALVSAVADHLTTDPDHRVLRTHGDGDGGLFTGILARYLALAAHSPALADGARQVARELVRGTADAFWSGHQLLSAPTTSGMPPAPVPVLPPVAVFSPDPTVSAEQTQPRGIPLELSTQLQAWMTLEAAATLATA